jgi:hypothetical protein
MAQQLRLTDWPKQSKTTCILCKKNWVGCSTKKLLLKQSNKVRWSIAFSN